MGEWLGRGPAVADLRLARLGTGACRAVTPAGEPLQVNHWRTYRGEQVRPSHPPTTTTASRTARKAAMRLVTLLAVICRVYASPLFKGQDPDHPKKHGHGNHGLPRESPEFWWKLGMSSLLVLAGGLFAGYALES